MDDYYYCLLHSLPLPSPSVTNHRVFVLSFQINGGGGGGANGKETNHDTPIWDPNKEIWDDKMKAKHQTKQNAAATKKRNKKGKLEIYHFFFRLVLCSV